MSIVKNIQTIAKTALLEEKVGKALEIAQAATDAAGLKGNLGSERGTVYQTGASTSGSSDGLANPVPADGVLGDKTTVVAQPVNNNTSSSPVIGNGISVVGSDKGTTTNTGTASGGTSSGGTTDLSNNTTSAPVGGSDLLDIGQGGAGDTVLSQLIQEAQAMHLPIATIQRMVYNYLDAKYATKGDKTTKQLADESSTAPQFNTGLPLNREVLKSVIGTNVANGKIVKVQLISTLLPTPSAVDTAAAYPPQGVWLDPNTPPPLDTFILEHVWKIISGVTTIYDQTFYGMISQIEELTSTKVYGYVGLLITTLSPQMGANLIFSSNFTGVKDQTVASVGGTEYIYTSGGSVTTSQYGSVTCLSSSPGSDVVCALPVPYETHYPDTGTMIAVYNNGQIETSAYDPGVDFATLHTLSSVITLAVGDPNGNIVDNRFLQIHPSIDGGYLLTVLAADGVTPNSANYYNAQGILTTIVPVINIPLFYPR